LNASVAETAVVPDDYDAVEVCSTTILSYPLHSKEISLLLSSIVTKDQWS